MEIPKAGGKGVRVLSIPTIRNRVIQGALKLILEPIFEADFQPGSYGYRPNRSAHEAVQRVAQAIVQHKTRVLDLDLHAYFDNIRHHQVLEKVARRVNDARVLHLLKLTLKASGKKGVAQGGVLSPFLSNVVLDELDKELETRGLRFCRYGDDCNIYVRSARAGARVMASISRFLTQRLKLAVSGKKSAVDRPQQRSFLGVSFTGGKSPNRRKIAPKALTRCKARVKELTRRSQGRSLVHGQ